MKAIRFVFLFLLLVYCLSISVAAEQMTIGDFSKFCKLPDEAQQKPGSPAETLQVVRCWGYLDGVTDGLVVAMTLGKGEKLFCLPDNGLSFEGSLRMVRDFIRSKKVPDDSPVRGVISAAYSNYFPCNK